MELHKLIFRVDFPPAFKLIGVWGDILELFNERKYWTKIGEVHEPRRIVAEISQSEKKQHDNLSVGLADINGTFETHPIGTTERYEALFKDVNLVIEKGGHLDF